MGHLEDLRGLTRVGHMENSARSSVLRRNGVKDIGYCFTKAVRNAEAITYFVTGYCATASDIVRI